MKTKTIKIVKYSFVILIFLFILYLPLTFIYSNDNFYSNDNNNGPETKKEISLNSNYTSVFDSNKFMIGLIHNGFNSADSYPLLTDSLLCNTWHEYGQWVRGPLWSFVDYLEAPLSLYKDYINSIITDNKNHNMKTLFMRNKLLYLCFGQRSDYQCEASGYNQDLFPYTYRDHPTGHDTMDNSIYGKNEIVRFCFVSRHDSGYVCKGLRANREQINIHANWGEYAVDNIYPWYVKPRIRIDSAFANNPSNFNKKVCRIEVLNFKGDTIYKNDIVAFDFKGYVDSIYHGNYLEEFPNKLLQIDTSKKFNPEKKDLLNDNCQVDFRVFWYKQCDMFIDYVRVENETAKKLLSGYYDTTWLKWEIDQIAVPNQNNIEKIYIEEFEFNQIPCMKYISDYIRSKNPNFSLMFDLNVGTYSSFKEDHSNFYDAGHIKRNLYDVIQPKEVFSYSYPLKARYYNENQVAEGEYYIPNTFGVDFNPSAGILAKAVTPSVYDASLQNLLDNDAGENHRITMKRLDLLSKNTNLPLIFMPQGHMVYWQYHKIKEPTNEEISLLTYLGLTYGAKGILHYAYGGGGCFTDYAVDSLKLGFDRGFTSPIGATGDSCNYIGPRRLINAYGQRKWEGVLEINKHLKKWGDYLLKFDIQTRNSYSYYQSAERNEMTGSTYITDILTYKPSIGAIPCQEVTTDSSEIRTSITPECKDERYVQTGFFQIQNEPCNRYFMMVNRRCSPFINETSQDNNGGRRLIKIRFNPANNSLPGFNNYKIIDLYRDSTIITFDKHSNQYIDLDWFKPGEARLYKIAPVMQEGGTLVCNEEVAANLSFTCNGMVYNNGKNITINTGTTINFKNDSTGIEMYGGSFLSGVTTLDGPPRVVFQGLNSALWKGIQLQNCPTVTVTYTDFKNIKYDSAVSYNNALNMINCANFFISKCNFTLDTKAGGVNMFFNFDNVKWEDYLVSYNNFTIPQGNANGPQPFGITSAGAGVMPIRIDGNAFTNSSGYAVPIAIFISGVTGGSVKNNSINNFMCSVSSNSSSIDFYGNTIYNNGSNSIGLSGNAGGTMYLSPNYTNYTGGENSISTLGTNSKNLKVENTYFYTDYGYNTFNISTPSTDSSYHYYGYFPLNASSRQQARYNCYQENSTATTTPTHLVTMGEGGGQINFIFNPRTCEPNGGEDFIVYSSPGVRNDTVVVRYNGSGSGMNENGISNEAVQSDNKKLLDSMNINLRKRLYTTVENQAHTLLNQYIDSTESLDAIAKLYFVTTILDSAGNKMNPLKSYYEGIIANNPGNTALLSRTFYFLQKCKVSLKQYSSAMQGFQLIIQQNPYSYEGLVASWDYASTHLLDSLYGHGGGYSNKIETGEEIMETGQILTNMFFENYDSTKYSKKQRTDMVKSINDVLEIKRITQTEKVIQLQKKSDEGNKEAARELKTLKVLNETIKKKTPRTVIELNHIIQGDVKKVFHIDSKDDGKKINLIPQTFELYQNYPNPFNPSTKIAFDLPKDGKIKLVIYDILGREIKTLINNEFRSAGKYITDFNGSNLASGIYFYRLQVSGGKEFTAVKKMVLIK